MAAIGVGDDAVQRIVLPLTRGFGYILHRAIATIRSDTTESFQWEDARLHMYFGTSETDTNTVEIEFPMGTVALARPSLFSSSSYVLGAGNNHTVGGNKDNPGGMNALSAPAGVVYGGVGSSPFFEVWNDIASTGPWTISYLFEWLIFNIEQAQYSGIYWNLPTRQ